MTQGEQHGPSFSDILSERFNPGGGATLGSPHVQQPEASRTTADQRAEEIAALATSQNVRPSFGLDADPQLPRIHTPKVDEPTPQDASDAPDTDSKPVSTDVAPVDSTGMPDMSGLTAIGEAGQDLPGPSTDVELYKEPPKPPTAIALAAKGQFLKALNQRDVGVEPVATKALVEIVKNTVTEQIASHVPYIVAAHPVIGPEVLRRAHSLGASAYTERLYAEKEAADNGAIQKVLAARMPDRTIRQQNDHLQSIAVEAGVIGARRTMNLRPPEETTKEALRLLGASKFGIDVEDGSVTVDMLEVGPSYERHTPEKYKTPSSRVRDDVEGTSLPPDEQALIYRGDTLKVVRRDNNSYGTGYVTAGIVRKQPNTEDTPDNVRHIPEGTHYAVVIKPDTAQVAGSDREKLIARVGAIEIDSEAAHILGAAIVSAATSIEQITRDGETEGAGENVQRLRAADIILANRWLTRKEAIGEVAGGMQHPGFQAKQVASVIKPPTASTSDNIIDAEVEE